MTHLSGFIAATYTPMHADRTLNLEAIEAYAEHLVAEGVTGVFVGGTTGESMSLTVEERILVVERWKTALPEGFPLIAHVGHTCLADCKRMAAHAQRAGVHAIAAVGPFFFKPKDVEDLVAFCLEIAETAEELPFYYYHIPPLTGITFPMRAFLEAAADRIPTLVGIKYSADDLYDFGRCVDFQDGRYTMLFGRDEALLGALAVGAAGAVGSTYNFATTLYRRLLDAHRAGDLATARDAQRDARLLVERLLSFDAISAGKAIMGMLGIDCGPVRPPLRSLAPSDVDALREALDEIGFFGERFRPNDTAPSS